MTDFKGFAGFRPIDRTIASIRAVPEVARLFEREASVRDHWAALEADASPDNLRQLFGAVLALPSSATESTVRDVIGRVKADGAKALGDAPDADVLAMVLEKLESQYGSGALSAIDCADARRSCRARRLALHEPDAA